jgi:hypothetical protein
MRDEEVVRARDELLGDNKFAELLNRFAHEQKYEARRIISGATTVEGMHEVIDRYCEIIVAHTSPGISSSGLEELKDMKKGGFLFVANHRNTIFDGLGTSGVLLKNGFERAYCASGNNLLDETYIGHILRSYNCFFFPRPDSNNGLSAKTPLILSQHIAKQRQLGNSVWIAQRVGPAIDGNDATDSRVVKMLYLAKPRNGEIAFSEWMEFMNIVPLSISYEILTCDREMAQTGYNLASNALYTEPPEVVEKNVVDGLTNEKGHVHYAFGTPIAQDSPDAVAATAEITNQIIGMYRLWPTNWVAYDHLNDNRTNEGTKYSIKDRASLMARVEAYPEHLRDIVYSMYAKPILNQQALGHNI